MMDSSPSPQLNGVLWLPTTMRHSYTLEKSERERQRERPTQRQRDRERERSRETDRERVKERERQTDSERERGRELKKERPKDRKKSTHWLKVVRLFCSCSSLFLRFFSIFSGQLSEELPLSCLCVISVSLCCFMFCQQNIKQVVCVSQTGLCPADRSVSHRPVCVPQTAEVVGNIHHSYLSVAQ